MLANCLNDMYAKFGENPPIILNTRSTNSKITWVALVREQIGNRKKRQVTRLHFVLATSTENFMKICPAISEERLTENPRKKKNNNGDNTLYDPSLRGVIIIAVKFVENNECCSEIHT